MPGIFPSPGVGGITPPSANLTNAYIPPASFTTSCTVTYLPNDCTARITASQINALTSELLAFAVCLDPNGTWDCASLTNLCANFRSYATGAVGDTSLVTDILNSLDWTDCNGRQLGGSERIATCTDLAESILVRDGTILGAGTVASPLSVRPATTNVRGIVEIATVSEALAGTSSSVVLTPQGMAAYGVHPNPTQCADAARATPPTALWGKDADECFVPFQLSAIQDIIVSGDGANPLNMITVGPDGGALLTEIDAAGCAMPVSVWGKDAVGATNKFFNWNGMRPRSAVFGAQNGSALTVVGIIPLNQPAGNYFSDNLGLVTITNPDSCKPVLMQGFVYVSRSSSIGGVGAYDSWVQVSFNGGAFTDNSIYRDTYPAVPAGLRMSRSEMIHYRRAFFVTIPAGGSITVDVRMRFQIRTPFPSALDRIENVVLTLDGFMTTT